MNTIITIIFKFSTFPKKKRRQENRNGDLRQDGIVVRKIPDRPTPSDTGAAATGSTATGKSAETRGRFADAKRRLDDAQAAHNANPNEASRHRLAEAIGRLQAACETKASRRSAARSIGRFHPLFKRAANQNES